MTATTISDVQELLTRFTLVELRHELKVAEVNTHADSDDFGYFLWYQDICRSAIGIKKGEKAAHTVSRGYINVEAVRARSDIVRIIEDAGIKLLKSGRNFKGLCPFHHEKTPSFIVNPERQAWHCFGACNAGGDVFSFVMRIENLDFRAAVKKVEAQC